MTAKRIQVYGLTAKEYDQLKTQAEKLGINSVSEYAKLVLSRVLSEKNCPLADFPMQAVVKISKDQEEQGEAEVHWIKPSLKLNAVETAFLREAAEQADMSISAFIRLALRSHLTNTAILNNEEVRALYQSNFQLLRIGRNLNQIARAFNAQGPVELTSQKINDVMRVIDDHTHKVRDLIISNEERLQ
ncbi:CopG family transcriptional regulator [Advenella sp. FME57]|uniref:ribbon-helix-helix domain-containing protein n=1 Tax=Advenella sp. FME57 TaxID=2742604 RepID=UPI001D02BF75|nr:CopG family transcriptional regulator [Advenella sp. FME57]